MSHCLGHASLHWSDPTALSRALVIPTAFALIHCCKNVDMIFHPYFSSFWSTPVPCLGDWHWSGHHCSPRLCCHYAMLRQQCDMVTFLCTVHSRVTFPMYLVRWSLVYVCVVLFEFCVSCNVMYTSYTVVYTSAMAWRGVWCWVVTRMDQATLDVLFSGEPVLKCGSSQAKCVRFNQTCVECFIAICTCLLRTV